MLEPREARSIIENAEQAAAAGNYASAEALLREAATLQEQAFGPSHPDLANTLNNLGIVCEMTDNPIDAEHYFRRAHAIAAATLAPSHPFVATSRKNLHDFCVARGRPVELPPAPPAMAAWLDTPAPVPAPRHQSHSATTRDVIPLPRRKFSRLAVGAVSGVGLLIVLLAMASLRGGRVEETTSRLATTTAPSRETPTVGPAVPPAEPLAQPPRTANAPRSTRSEAHPIGVEPSTPSSPAVMPTVAAARLCTVLSAWRCEAADSQVPSGPMFFYTQLKSATATTIEHRWYQGDRLRRAVQLRVEANLDAGYRTYSRITTSNESGGNWRVELRSADGAVLHEERFTVQ